MVEATKPGQDDGSGKLEEEPNFEVTHSVNVVSATIASIDFHMSSATLIGDISKASKITSAIRLMAMNSRPMSALVFFAST